MTFAISQSEQWTQNRRSHLENELNFMCDVIEQLSVSFICVFSFFSISYIYTLELTVQFKHIFAPSLIRLWNFSFWAYWKILNSHRLKAITVMSLFSWHLLQFLSNVTNNIQLGASFFADYSLCSLIFFNFVEYKSRNFAKHDTQKGQQKSVSLVSYHSCYDR